MKVQFQTQYRSHNQGAVAELDERESQYVISKGFAKLYTGTTTVVNDEPVVDSEMAAKLSRNIVGGEHGELVNVKRFGTLPAPSPADESGVDFSSVLASSKAELSKPIKVLGKKK